MSMGRHQIETAVYQGARSYQQDCVARLADADGTCVIGILSDGIGGHGYGQIASKIIVRTCVENLEDQISAIRVDAGLTPSLLENAALAANRKIAKTSMVVPKTKGMGATLIAAAIVDDRLYWCSIGDSHVQVFGNGTLQRVNQDHSLADGLANLAKIGVIDSKTVATSGQRNSLTASVSGEKLSAMDCPKTGIALRGNEVVIIASDGIETLSSLELAELCQTSRSRSAAELCGRVISAVEAKQRPQQDNLSLVVMVTGQS